MQVQSSWVQGSRLVEIDAPTIPKPEKYEKHKRTNREPDSQKSALFCGIRAIPF
jgi:hypothetical protein